MDPVAPTRKARANWRGLSLALLSGLLLAFAYPPLSLWWLAYIALVPLYWAIVPRTAPAINQPPLLSGTHAPLPPNNGGFPEGASPQLSPNPLLLGGRGAKRLGSKPELYGFAFAFMLFAVGMFWMNALASPLWATLCVIMGVCFGGWAWLTARIVPHCPAWLRPLVFAAGWTLFEWIRSLGVYAFPWFLLATSQTQPYALYFAQAADLGGQWLITFAIVAINGYLAEGIPLPLTPSPKGKGELTNPAPSGSPDTTETSLDSSSPFPLGEGVRGRGKPIILVIALGIFLTLGVYGALTLPQYTLKGSAMDEIPPVPVAIVQGNEDKAANWEQRLQTYLELTRTVDSRSRLILWPEGTISIGQFYAVENLARQKNIPILAGLSASNQIDGQIRPRNIARLTGSTDEYIKRRLAPFGEVYPFRKQLASVYKSFGVNVDSYQTGVDPAVFPVGGLHIGPIICYESAFPWVSRATVRAGADTLAFLTSDQTFDGTSEHAQHLALVQIRCIETRRYGVRAATSGISAELRPNGQIVHRLESSTRGLLNATVTPLSNRTLAVRWGDWWLLVCGALVVEGIRRAIRSHRPKDHLP
ncbi:MAG: apolipoprotein N-acyltransferase [Armatimonas sp.]